jgi:hypothetical protein
MYIKGISIAVVLAVASVVAGASRAPGQTLPATADSFIRSVGDNANEGSQTFLRIQNSGDNRALVRFDQASIASAIGGGNLLSATLEVFIELNNDSWGSGPAWSLPCSNGSPCGRRERRPSVTISTTHCAWYKRTTAASTARSTR